jgi:hypothetical protein
MRADGSPRDASQGAAGNGGFGAQNDVKEVAGQCLRKPSIRPGQN